MAPPHALTAKHEWLVRILYLNPEGRTDAASTLLCMHSRMTPQGFDRGASHPEPSDPMDVYGFDFVAKALGHIGGKPIRFDCMATAMTPSGTWRERASVADGFVLVASDSEAALALLAGVSSLGRSVPITFLVHGQGWDDAACRQLERESAGIPVSAADLAGGGAGVIDAFKPLAKLVLTELKEKVELPREPPPDRPWWRFWS